MSVVVQGERLHLTPAVLPNSIIAPGIPGADQTHSKWAVFGARSLGI